MTDDQGGLSYKNVALELKADENGITGYGAVFGNVDSYGDIIERGAFDGMEGKEVPMLWQHDASMPIGVWQEMSEDDFGLRVKGVMADTTAARDARKLVDMRAIGGLSIGYRAIDWDRRDGYRILKKVEVWEVSLATFPANSLAVIDAAKAGQMTERELEQRLTRDAKFSRSVARTLMSEGFKGLIGKQDAGDDAEIEALAEWLRQQKT